MERIIGWGMGFIFGRTIRCAHMNGQNKKLLAAHAKIHT